MKKVSLSRELMVHVGSTNYGIRKTSQCTNIRLGVLSIMFGASGLVAFIGKSCCKCLVIRFKN